MQIICLLSADSFTLSVTVAASLAQTGLFRGFYTDLPFRSLYYFSNSLISGLTTVWTVRDGRVTKVRLGICTLLRDLIVALNTFCCMCVTSHLYGVIKRVTKMTSAVFKLLLTLLGQLYDLVNMLFISHLTLHQRLCYCVIQQRNGGKYAAANVATGVSNGSTRRKMTLSPHLH